MKNRFFSLSALAVFLSLGALGIPRIALSTELALDGQTVRFELPSGWEQVRVRFPRDEDRPALSELLITYPPTGGEVPTIYVRLDLRALNALEGLSLIESTLDELRSIQKQEDGPALLIDCSATPPPSGYMYRFEEQIQLQDGSYTEVSVNQDACGVRATTRIDLGGDKTLEIGMVSPVETFETAYLQVFLPVVASFGLEPKGG